MARKPKSEPQKSDPRIQDLGRTIEVLRKAHGLSKRQLGLKSGVDQSHLGKFIKGTAGLGAEQLLNVLAVLEAGLAIDRHDAEHPGPGSRPSRLVGTIGARGVVKFFSEVAMTGAFRVESDFGGRIKATDTVVIEPGDWTEGKLVLVEHGPGDYRMHECKELHGLRFLVAGDTILLDPDRHRIVGVAVERREAM